jgi:hypothetical protein
LVVSLGNDFNSLTCEAWANLGATFPIADDRSAEIWRDFGSGAIPRNTIIDQNGVVRYNRIGFDEAAVNAVLDDLLAVTATDEKIEFPRQHRLISVFPNPFNGETQIKFELQHSGHVSLTILDGRGGRVRQLLSTNARAGSYQVFWNGRDESGAELPSGVYLATLAHDQGSHTRKILLLK